MHQNIQIELIWLEDCLALKQTLNFSQAASIRNITQPAFSRRIQSLEGWIGTTLFQRSRRSVTLTKAGEVFCDEAATLINLLYNARRKTLETSELYDAEVVFTATHSLSFAFFPSWIKRSKTANLLNTFQLVSNTMRACERIFTQGQSQFLLCHHLPKMNLKLESGDYISIKVGSDNMVLVSAPDPDSGKPKWSLEDKAIPFLSYSGESGLGRILSGQPAVVKLTRHMRTVFTSDLASTLLAMAVSGEGVAWLPFSIALGEMLQGNLMQVTPIDTELKIPVEVRLFRHAAPMTRTAEELWEHIVQNAALTPD
ncbi:LysR family transcriptional regulator [Sodalis ligni]|uniref:Transcriptional regulator n=1 Tax=Sodalis ligni TaxID=2697027 RepID=A0A4V6NFN9_9GAMM|nr:LysR family transcriptional regulator [Sodalis ligni]TCL05038.1 transcriptional regulator [Sodalis ligni]